LFLLKSLLNHLLFVDFLERAAVLEAEVAEHLEEALADLLEVLVALALAQLVQQGVLVLEHLVHVVAVLLLSAAVVLSNLSINLV
jgi:hypothetical protein